MNKKEIMGLCEFLKIHGYENPDNISKFIFELQQENKKLTGAIQTYDILLKSNVEENKQLKIQISAREEVCNKLENNWNKLKEYINKYIKYDNDGRKISKCLNAIVIMNKINKLEQGSDKNVEK